MMNRFMSPVFLSVNDRGEVKEGLGGVPDYEEGRSILFVGNHQLMGIDMPILVRHAQPVAASLLSNRLSISRTETLAQ